MLLEFFDSGGTFLVLAFAELDFELLEFDFLGEGFEFAVVAHVLLLFLVLLDHFLVVGDLGVAGLVGGLGFFDFGGEVLDAGVQACDFVFKVLYGLGQFATDDLDFVDFAVDALEGVESDEAFFDRHVHVGTENHLGFCLFFGFFGADFLCHCIIYFIIIQSYILNDRVLSFRNTGCKVTKFF